jgi:hypothetical protein
MQESDRAAAGGPAESGDNMPALQCPIFILLVLPEAKHQIAAKTRPDPRHCFSADPRWQAKEGEDWID